MLGDVTRDPQVSTALSNFVVLSNTAAKASSNNAIGRDDDRKRHRVRARVVHVVHGIDREGMRAQRQGGEQIDRLPVRLRERVGYVSGLSKPARLVDLRSPEPGLEGISPHMLRLQLDDRSRA